MDNSDIEKAGFDAVRKYETNAGRSKIERTQKCGFDFITSRTDNSDERHIEVKATTKKLFTSRWLEQLEQEVLDSDQMYYLYLVTEAESNDPKIYVYTRDEVKKRFCHAETKYVYKFPKKDFVANR
jgi:hypothetical protein